MNAHHEPRFTIELVAIRCRVSRQTILRLESEGIVARSINGDWFSERDIERIEIARRLMNDLGLNLNATSVVMHLRDQVVTLQRELGERARRT